MSAYASSTSLKLHQLSCKNQRFSKSVQAVRVSTFGPKISNSRSLSVRVYASDEKPKSLRDMASNFGKKVTGNENYEFGDITKNAAGMAKEGIDDVMEKAKDGIEDLGKDLTGDEEYELGDLTKKVVQTAKDDTQKLKEAADAAGQVITEDDEYKFGDFTKNLLKKAKKGIDDIAP